MKNWIHNKIRHVFTEEIDKIDLRLNDDKRTQSIDSIEIHA